MSDFPKRPEDLTGEVGVYELVSRGRVAFVEDATEKGSARVEQKRDGYLFTESGS